MGRKREHFGRQRSQHDIWNYLIEANILYPCCNSILVWKSNNFLSIWVTAIWGCFYSSVQRRDRKIHLDGGIEGQKGRKGLLKCKWFRTCHRSLLSFLFESEETEIQRGQGNWFKLIQLEGAGHKVCELCLCTMPFYISYVGGGGTSSHAPYQSLSSYQSFAYFSPQSLYAMEGGIYRLWETLTWLTVAHSSHPDWPCPVSAHTYPQLLITVEVYQGHSETSSCRWPKRWHWEAAAPLSAF